MGVYRVYGVFLGLKGVHGFMGFVGFKEFRVWGYFFSELRLQRAHSMCGMGRPHLHLQAGKLVAS